MKTRYRKCHQLKLPTKLTSIFYILKTVWKTYVQSVELQFQDFQIQLCIFHLSYTSINLNAPCIASYCMYFIDDPFTYFYTNF